MQSMVTTAAAELFELKPVRRVLLVLGRHIIALFAISTLQNDIVSCALCHFLPQKTY